MSLYVESRYADLARHFRLGETLTAGELRLLHTLAAAHGNHRLERLTSEAAA